VKKLKFTNVDSLFLGLLPGIFLTDVLGLILKRREQHNALVGSGQSSEQGRGLMVKRNEVRAGGSFYQIAKNKVERK